MKILSKQVLIDENTFEPYLKIDLTIPLEAMQTGQPLLTDDEVALIMGKELVLQLSEQYFNGEDTHHE